MSYILDALRRADAERERGAVPGLHSQAVAASSEGAAAGGRRGPWLFAGAGAAVFALGATAWWIGRGAAPSAVAVAPLPLPSSTSAPAPAAMAVPMPVPSPAWSGAPTPALDPVPVPAPFPATTASPNRARVPAPTSAPGLAPTPAPTLAPTSAPNPAAIAAPSGAPTPAPTRAPAAAPMPAPAPQAVAAPAPPAASAGATTSLAPAASAPPAAPRPAQRIVPWEQLPDDVRRQIPPLAIGGAIYSDNAASRMLIVGGQLLHEGDNAAPGVVLEQIKPRSAVLRWRDLRYEVGY